MSYRANRGGHAPGHLRDAFLEYLDRGCEIDLRHRVKVGYEGKQMSIRSLIGLLWNCTDILPGHYCSELDLPAGSTYAIAVRKLYRVACLIPL